MTKKRIAAALAVMVLSAAAVGAFLILRRNQAPQAAVEPAKPVAAQTAEVVLPGRIQARESLTVPVPVDGRINTFHVEVGDEVYEGQVLADIRNEEVEGVQENANLELERAQQRVNNLEGLIAAARLEASRAGADALRVRSEFDRATREYERQRLLFAEGATPRRTFEKAEAAFRALEAESEQLTTVAHQSEERVSTVQRDLDAARKILEAKVADVDSVKSRLEAGQVLSPATGLVAARRGQVGDHVNPMIEDLFVIATELSQMDVIVEPEPPVLARIKPGQPAFVVLADLPNDPLQGTVRAMEGGKVTIEFVNPSPLVKPGMTAQVRIPLG